MLKLEVLVEDKGSGEKGGSTADQVITARPEVSIVTPSIPPLTTTIFGDEDLTIAQTLIKLRSEKEKEKGVAFRMDADHELAEKETIGSRKSRGNKEQTTYRNSSQEHDDYLPQTYGMLRKFDRQDLVDLHRLVMKRFEDNTSEGYNLLLWGDLKYFELLQLVSREKVSSHQGNAREDVELEARS
nr:hypothetical protein [Tanacetum cinerariifolium]